jgi:16S rRNA (guanine527-N7)-methyltransferase
MMEKLSSGATELGLPLNPRQLEQFAIYYQELISWNRRVNLTRITDYDEVQVKHFLDSLTAVLTYPVTNGTDFRLIDVGTGAGMPGLPVKILLPEVRLVLLESVAKKTAFLRHLRDRLKLDDVEIMAGRAETLAHQQEYREAFDLVLARAVAPLATLVELTLPFCTVGGVFIGQKKGDIELEVSQAGGAIGLLGGRLREIRQIELAHFTEPRQLVVIDKVSPTPASYPRRAGLPAKRPLAP